MDSLKVFCIYAVILSVSCNRSGEKSVTNFIPFAISYMITGRAKTKYFFLLCGIQWIDPIFHFFFFFWFLSIFFFAAPSESKISLCQDILSSSPGKWISPKKILSSIHFFFSPLGSICPLGFLNLKWFVYLVQWDYCSVPLLKLWHYMAMEARFQSGWTWG